MQSANFIVYGYIYISCIGLYRIPKYHMWLGFIYRIGTMHITEKFGRMFCENLLIRCENDSLFAHIILISLTLIILLHQMQFNALLILLST